MANGLDVHRGSWPKMSNNTYTRLAVPGLSGSLSFDIQKVHSGKLEELEAAEIIAFEWVTFSDKNFQENHLTIIPSFSGDTEEDMAAAALSRRQTTQVCTQGRKKVKLIQKDYLDQLLKKKSIVAERQIRTIIQFPHTILKLRKGNAPAHAVGKYVPDQFPVQGDFQIAALFLSTLVQLRCGQISYCGEECLQKDSVRHRAFCGISLKDMF